MPLVNDAYSDPIEPLTRRTHIQINVPNSATAADEGSHAELDDLELLRAGDLTLNEKLLTFLKSIQI